MNNNVAVVILNWDGKKFLDKFLPSVVEHSGNAEIYVADNGSKDGSVEFLKQNFPTVKVICFNKNYGFAKGYNMALKQIEAEYFVLLNSDVEVTPNWIPNIITFLDENEDYVACQPKILTYGNKEYFEYSGGAGGFIDRYGYPFCRGRLFDTLEKDVGQYNDNCEIFWATGACLFVRSQAFHEFGGFDEDFFAHMEEIDLCWRFKNAGYKIGYCYNSVVYHVGGGSLPKSSPFKTYLNIRNNEVMLIKNLYKPSFHIVLFRFLLDFVASFKFWKDGSFKDFTSVIKAHFYVLSHLISIKHKQKNIEPKKVSCIYKRLLIWEYFVKKKKTFNQLNKKDFIAKS